MNFRWIQVEQNVMDPINSLSGRILVVDDESTICQMCQRKLHAAGYDVDVAAGGQQALARLAQAPFDVVLSDMAMPGEVQGLDLLARVRVEYPTVDMIIMTAFPTLETAIPTLRNGAYDYLIKPFDQDLLAAVVNRCFEKRRLAATLEQERTWRHELEAAYAELKRLEKLKESFLARLSHELRTPFVSVYYAIELLERQIHAGKTCDSLDHLRGGIDRLWSLVQNLLVLADFEQHKAVLRKKPMVLGPVLDRLIQAMRSEWQAKNLKIQTTGGALGRTYWFDPEMIETAFRHLIQNAIQFNVPGGKIDIDVNEFHHRVHIQFADTGIGIPLSDLSKAFDAFYQIAEYLTRKVGGLGVGLALVRRITEAHGGQVFVCSEEGKGSTFKLVLPNLPNANAVFTSEESLCHG